MTENGIDTSGNNPGVPDATITANFILFKATEGVGYTDSDCNASYQEALAAGKQVGVYHFARFDGNDPEDEAVWFASQIQGYLGTATLMLDYEVAPINPDLAKRFLDKLYDLTKVKAFIYMSQSRFQSQDWSALMPDYAAWPAMYGANNPQTGYGDALAPVSVNGNWTIAGTQYTSAGHLPGYAGNLDFDIFFGDAVAWNKYAKGDRDLPTPAPVPVTDGTDPAIEVTAETAPVVTPVPTPVVEPILPSPKEQTATISTYSVGAQPVTTNPPQIRNIFQLIFDFFVNLFKKD